AADYLVRTEGNVPSCATRQAIDSLILAQHHVGDASIAQPRPVKDERPGRQPMPTKDVGLRQRGGEQLAGSGKTGLASGPTGEACNEHIAIEVDASRRSISVAHRHAVGVHRHLAEHTGWRTANLRALHRTRTAKVVLNSGPNGAALEDLLEDPEWVPRATIGSHDDRLPAMTLLASVEVPLANFPAACSCLAHHFADIGDDRSEDGRIVKAVLPTEPPHGLVHVFQAVDATVQSTSTNLQLAR